jgi:ABC-type uncharacterized transport system substrate-binding protein
MKTRALAFLLAAAPGPAAAAPVVVVAPETGAAPYQEALQGVCDALGACPPVLPASSARLSIPADTRVVIALGGRAARRSYPARAALVTALVPGFEARTAPEDGSVTRVPLEYSPAEFARRLKELKPGAKRIVLLWSADASGRYAAAVREAAAGAGFEAVEARAEEADEIPSLLRALPDADAVWLAPDPELVTPVTFDAVREYAQSRGAAFFSPAPGLCGRGALPGLAPSFREAGLRAGAAARALLDGGRPEAEAYPGGAAADVKGLVVSSRTTVQQPR